MANIILVLTVLFKVWLSYLEAFYRIFFPPARKDIKGKVIQRYKHTQCENKKKNRLDKAGEKK